MEKWNQITLRLDGDELDLLQVSALLDIKPTEIYKKGEHISQNPKYARYKKNGWRWLVPCDVSVKAEDQLNVLLDKLALKSKELRTILSQPGNSGDIFIGSGQAKAGNCTLYLTPKILEVISQLNLNLYIDFYP